MKKIYSIALAAFISSWSFGQSFFVPTTYRGAFAPAPTAQWTDGWTNWDPQNTAYGTSTVNVTTSITNNTTWTSNNVYLLQGQIYVKNGAVLTIQPGTIIMGDKNTAGSGLFVTQGSKLIADGTVSSPIIFTSNQPAGSRALGDWGGIILMGRASNNNPGGIANVEGLAVSPDTQFGGGTSPDDNDNSGILRYVRIEFGGYVYLPNKEINGLTLGAIGRGTTIDNIQVSFSNDDAYEWFGGTVNCRHLVSFRNLDDDFDTDNGFSGSVQFCVAVRDPLIADNPSVSTSEGFESDNDAAGSTNAPQTSAIFSNVTHIGPLRGNTAATVATGYRRGARIRRNSGLKIYNSIFMDDLRGLHIDGTACEGNANSGALKFKNNMVAGYLTNYSVERNAGSTFNVSTWFGLNSNDSIVSSANILIAPYGATLNNYLSPDYRPTGTSVALNNISFADNTIAPKVIVAPTTTATYTYCQGATATALTATGNADCTIKWYTTATGGTAITAPTPSITTAGVTNYYVAQQSADGTEGPRAMVTITVNATPATPTISASGATSFCTGGSVVLTSSEAAGNVWSNTATTAAITVSASGTFSVTYTDNNGCSASSSETTVNVSNAPVPTINASATAACSGDSIVLTSSTADSYLWSNNATTPSITVTTTGNYTVTTTNADACAGVGTSAPTVITFGTTPTANATFTVNGNVVTFTNTSTDATSYSWDFADFSGSSAASPVHAFAANGSYDVVLTAINGNCTSTFTITVAISVGLEEFTGLTEVVLFPNPTSGEMFLTFSSETNETAQTMIIDQLGKVVSTSSIEVNAGANTVAINAEQLGNGMYTLLLNTGRGSIVRKMIVQK